MTLDKIILSYQKFAPLFLRLGLAIVFFLFGFQKLANPSQATAEIQLLLNFELADAAAINFYLGLVEILTAIAFLAGFKIRIFALIASFLVAMFFLSFFYISSIDPAPSNISIDGDGNWLAEYFDIISPIDIRVKGQAHILSSPTKLSVEPSYEDLQKYLERKKLNYVVLVMV